MTGSLKLEKEPTSILIILMGSIGDVTRGLSLAHQIKINFPTVKLTWLVEPACKTIVSLNQYVDRVIVYDRPKNIFALPKLVKELREENFDITLDLQRHSKSGFFSALSAAPLRIGFDPSSSKEFNHLFNNHHIEALPPGSPKLQSYLSFIKKLGKDVTYPLDFGLKKVKDQPQQKALLENLSGDYVCFILGSSWESKDWTAEGYIALAGKILSATALKIVLLGDKTQTKIAAEVESAISDNIRVINLAGKTSLTDVVAVIDKSKFALGPDSGPGHISGALGKNYISLFGPTDPRLTAPIGSENLVIQSNLGCMPCYKRKCPGLGKLCMHLISADKVFEKVKGLASGQINE